MIHPGPAGLSDPSQDLRCNLFYGQEGEDAVAYHRTAAALSSRSPTGLTIVINGGYTTK